METEIVDDSLLAVVAHDVLNSLCVTRGNLALLVESWDVLPESHRRLLVERADVQAQLAADMLGRLARGLPADAKPASAA